MKPVVKLVKLISYLCGIFFFLGCAAKYMTPSLESFPTNELALIEGWGQSRTGKEAISAIDGIPMPFSFWTGCPDLYIFPGKHLVHYHTTAYLGKKQRVVGRCVLNCGPGYSVQYHSVDMVPVDSPILGECFLTFEAGQTYDAERTFEMLKTAGCNPKIIY